MQAELMQAGPAPQIAPSEPSPAWGAFLRRFATTALALALAALAFDVLLDPYGANPLRLRFERPLMDINQRFMYPQVLRSGVFDSAVFGTSTVRLLKPSDLESDFGGRFGNFGMNAATPFEQGEAVRLYLAHTPDLRTLVWGIDPSWCEADADAPAKRVTARAFPPWLYDGSGLGEIPHLFNLRTLEIAARLVMNRLGLMKPRLPRDGYEVFTPPESLYDLERARAHIWGGAPRSRPATATGFQAGEAERASWRYPALDQLGAILAAMPRGGRLVMLFPPVHVAIQPVPGSREEAFEAECKRRVAAIAAAHGGVTVDFRFASPITGEDSHYWDPLHYRLPIARRVTAALREAGEGRQAAEDFQIVPSR